MHVANASRYASPVYWIDIDYQSKVHLPKSGSRCIQVLRADASSCIYHSGSEHHSGLYDITIAMNVQPQSALNYSEPVSPRHTRSRVRNTPFKVTVPVVYAPTLQAEPTAKDAF